jgi:xanthine dehydrogenase FAD-binding subunit
VGFSLLVPETAREACRLLAESAPGETVALAGGTDLLLDLDGQRLAPRTVVSLRRMPWRAFRWTGTQLTIGSLTPLSELEVDSMLRRRLPGLYAAIHAVGSLALRHRATIGGNLGRASPASDLIPILLALDAEVSIVGPLGSRSTTVDALIEGPRSLALTPGELIESVTLPEAVPCAYVWQRVRPSNDISQVGVALAAPGETASWRLSLGGIWPRPQRLREAEHRLVSATPTGTEIELAAQEAAQRAPFTTDKRATEAYRRRLVGALVRRAVHEVMSPPPTRPKATKRRRSR